MPTLLLELYREAPDHVQRLAAASFGVGLFGVLLCLFYIVRLEFATRRLNRALQDDVAEAWTGELAVFASVVSGGEVSTSLSPDATWDFIDSRLESGIDHKRAELRFLGYLPLLIGLAATMLGLAGLVPKLGLAMTEDVRASLRGVFIGTLSGVASSALVGVWGLVFAISARRLVVAAELYVHSKILPAIPERRIGVHIESALLDVIAERSGQVVDAFKAGLSPIAVSLAESATSSSAAAMRAVQSFEHAAAALKDAGNLRSAAKIVATHLLEIEKAAEHVARAATDVSSASGQALQASQSWQGLATSVDSSAATFAGAGASVAGGIQRLEGPLTQFAIAAEDAKAASSSVTTQLAAIESGFRQVAVSIEGRNSLEQQHIGELENRLKQLGDPLARLHTTLQEISSELAAARGATETFRTQAAAQLSEHMDSSFATLADRLGGVLDPIAAVIPRSSAELDQTTAAMKLAAQQMEARVPAIIAALEPVKARLTGIESDISRALTSIGERLPAAGVTPIQPKPDEAGAVTTAMNVAVRADLSSALTELSAIRILLEEQQRERREAVNRGRWWTGLRRRRSRP